MVILIKYSSPAIISLKGVSEESYLDTNPANASKANECCFLFSYRFMDRKVFGVVMVSLSADIGINLDVSIAG